MFFCLFLWLHCVSSLCTFVRFLTLCIHTLIHDDDFKVRTTSKKYDLKVPIFPLKVCDFFLSCLLMLSECDGWGVWHVILEKVTYISYKYCHMLKVCENFLLSLFLSVAFLQKATNRYFYYLFNLVAGHTIKREKKISMGFDKTNEN